MNQYDYMRQLAAAEEVPQSLRAIPQYREPVRAFAESEAARQMRDQQMAIGATSRAMELERGKGQLGLSRGRLALGKQRLGLDRQRFEQDIEFAGRQQRAGEKARKWGIPFEIASLGVEALRGWKDYIAGKEADDQKRIRNARQREILNVLNTYVARQKRNMDFGQAERERLTRESGMFDVLSARPPTAPPITALPYP